MPVGEFVVDKLLDEASGARGIIAVEFAAYALDERVETRDDPAVDLGSVGAKLGVLGIVAIHVGVEGEETVCVVQCPEELTFHFSSNLRLSQGSELVII